MPRRRPLPRCSRRSMVNDVHPTTIVLLQPLVFLLQPPKAAPVVPPAPASHGRLCYRGGLTARVLLPPLARPSLHSPAPPVILRRRQRSRTSEPSYSSPRGLALLRLPRLRVVPFLGVAIVHHPGALGVAWSTWSMNDFHQKSTVRGERLTAGSMAAARKCLLITQKIMIPPPDSRDPPDRPPYFMKKTFPP